MNAARLTTDGTRADRGQLARPRDLALAPRRHDGARNRIGLELLTIDINDAGKRLLAVAVDDACSGNAGIAHAHVQRPVMLYGKSALGHLQLVGRDTKVQDDPIDRPHPLAREQFLHGAERPVDQRQPARKFPNDFFTTLNRGRIPVQSDHIAIRRPQDRPRIAPTAKRPVYERLAITWRQRIQDLGKQDRQVDRFVHRDPSRGGSRSFPRRSAVARRACALRASRARGSQISK